ncbi:hypothetical protein NPA07_03940 [Mycoplasmopsis caviae]|uniref:Uncharacterized protein n=1 Tax=Mycoplasmopsis caviae TaxID=55603 RepID=A0A3P8MES6_9BACT|nr:hypothetical protein [Mycoplasmopsis caviae]UUD34936.1 hypothetical protein NPA07_03940 [Mycoplasmopsis caviae]VDR42236.1 Uncharacterised protein [Mycoplasmopsis caviae]
MQVNFAFEVEEKKSKVIVEKLEDFRSKWSGKNIYIEYAKNFSKQLKAKLEDAELINNLKQQPYFVQSVESDINTVFAELKTLNSKIENQYKSDTAAIQ